MKKKKPAKKKKVAKKKKPAKKKKVAKKKKPAKKKKVVKKKKPAKKKKKVAKKKKPAKKKKVAKKKKPASKKSTSSSRKRNKTWKNKKEILDYIELIAMRTGHKTISFTRDAKFTPNKLSQFMDKKGGWYHRVKHGHDFALNTKEVYKKFGAKGIMLYPAELTKDFLTPHGIPVPTTQAWVNKGLVSPKFATNWMSLNIADVLTGGIAVYSTFRLYKRTKKGRLSKRGVIKVSVGIGIKIYAGVVTHNPVLVISGIADCAILACNLLEGKDALKRFLKLSISTGAIGACVGVGATALAKSTVATLGTASTGTAISALSGGAASKATLAWFGGGSLATGGFGVAGGLVALSVTGIGIGLVAGIVSYKLLS